MLQIAEGTVPATVLETAEVCRRLSEWVGAPGSLTLSRLDEPWPMLSVLISGDWAVLHLSTARVGPLLTLAAVSPVLAPDECEFVVAGGRTVFDREYLHPRSAAAEVVGAFAIDAPWRSSVRWEEL